MRESSARHWDGVYAATETTAVSWYEPSPDISLRLLTAHVRPGATVIDVGAGASFLADALLERGCSVTVLDVSARALAVARRRLGPGAAVHFVVADVLSWTPDRAFDAWHDRAVFHFLTDPADQARYVEVAATAVGQGGVLVLGAFAEDGPQRCSGLPTARYGAGRLATLFAAHFTPGHAERAEHVTPAGVIQPFTWVVLRRTG